MTQSPPSSIESPLHVSMLCIIFLASPRYLSESMNDHNPLRRQRDNCKHSHAT